MWGVSPSKIGQVSIEAWCRGGRLILAKSLAKLRPIGKQRHAVAKLERAPTNSHNKLRLGCLCVLSLFLCLWHLWFLCLAVQERGVC